MTHNIRRAAVALAAPALAAALALTPATTQAVGTPTPGATTYQAECGSCHTAYPARFLKPAEWTTVLARLDQHYGTDAALDSTSMSAVARQLGVSAPSAAVATTATLPRITRSHWFLEEHDEVPAAKFKSPAVQSAANCAACHAGADRGDFDEHAVRIPQ